MKKNIVLLNAKGATLISKSDPISQTLVRNTTKETSPQYIRDKFSMVDMHSLLFPLSSLAPERNCRFYRLQN